jgi:MFS family permease
VTPTSHPLAALRNRAFRWFFIATAVRMLGTSMTPVALAFAVLHVDNSPGSLSRVLAAYMTAQVLFILVGGLTADRLSRTLVLQGSFLLSCGTQAAVAALLLSGRASIASILILEAVNGAAGAFGLPATQGIVPQLVNRADLQPADALMAFARRGAMILGPAIAGVLVATAGPGWAILCDAIGFALGALALTRVRLPGPPAAAEGDASTGTTSLFAQLHEGFTQVRTRTWLWVIILVFGIANAIQSGAWSVLGPIIAERHPGFGARGWGLAVSAEAVGAIASTLVLMRLPLNRPLRQGMIGATAIAIPLVTLGIRPETMAVAAGALIAGAGTAVFGTGWNVALMEHIPQEALSRVASFDMLGSFLAIPAGTLFYGWLATRASLEPILVISGTDYAALTLATLLVPSITNLRRVGHGGAGTDSSVPSDIAT